MKLFERALAGGNLCATPALFTADGRYFLSTAFNNVRLHSTSTGDIIRQFSTQSSSSHGTDNSINTDEYPVVDVQLNPDNQFQLLLATADGRVQLWDYEDGVCLEEWRINGTILSMRILQSSRSIAARSIGGERLQFGKSIEIIVCVNSQEKYHVRWLKLSFTAAAENSQGDKQQQQSQQSQTQLVKSLYQSATPINSLQVTKVESSGPAILLLITGKELMAAHLPPPHDQMPDDGDDASNSLDFHSLRHSNRLTALAVVAASPSLVYDGADGSIDGVVVDVAVGDERGQIHLWHFCSDHKQALTTEPPRLQLPQPTKLHWHAHAVHSLHFSPDGSHLYSGGEEAVLVGWNLRVGDHKQFLPRLGGTVRQLAYSMNGGAANQPLIACSLGDNSVKLVSVVHWQVRLTVQGLKCCAGVEDFGDYALRNSTGGLVKQPTMVSGDSQTVVLAGQPGTLQFWDCVLNKSVYELDISPRPQLHRNDSGFLAARNAAAHVDQVAFSACGRWMATVDVSGDAADGSSQSPSALTAADPDSLKTIREMNLKFWRFEDGRFQLHSRIMQPHSRPITSLTFSPGSAGSDQLISCTTSLDGTFKLWSGPAVVKPRKQQQHWICYSTGSWRHQPASAAAFSADGSVLAVSFGSTITLWNPKWLQFINTIVIPAAADTKSDSMRYLSFIGVNQLLCSATNSLTIWDVVQGRQLWSLPVSVRLIAVESGAQLNGKSGKLFAIVADCQRNSKSGSLLMVFNTNQFTVKAFGAHRPLSAHYFADTVRSVEFMSGPNSTDLFDFTIAVLDSRHQLRLLSPTILTESLNAEKSLIKLSEKDPAASGRFFSALFSADERKSAISTAATGLHPSVDSLAEKFTLLWDAPSHVLPPGSRFYEHFMGALVASPTAVTPTAATVVPGSDAVDAAVSDTESIVEDEIIMEGQQVLMSGYTNNYLQQNQTVNSIAELLLK